MHVRLFPPYPAPTQSLIVGDPPDLYGKSGILSSHTMALAPPQTIEKPIIAPTKTHRITVFRQDIMKEDIKQK